MVDCGATSQFIDQDFALKNGLKLRRKAVPEVLTVVDGRTSVAGDLTHEVTIQLLIDQHLENVVFQVTKLGSVPLILGKTWLRRHNPLIDWTNNTVNFRSAWCQAHCLPHRHEAPEPSRATPAASSFSISMIGAAGYTIAARQKHSISFVATIRDLFPEDDDDNDNVPGDSKQDMEQLRKLVPPEYHDHLLLFTKKEADKLPPHRYIDHEIPLEEGAKPSFGPLYSMSASELKEVRAWLKEHLSKGFIRASQSSAASPILFVKKKDGSLRLCVDYRALNAITKKNGYPLPLIEETLRQVAGARYFTRLDLRSAFNLIRIKAGDEWKTAFRTRYGLFEFLVMPFGLTNAPASCQQFVNDTLREYLDIFCAVYIDDILIYSKSRKEHKEHVRKILAKLEEAGLYVKAEKCEFSVSQTSFLGFIVGADGISMDPAKIQATREWEAPKNVRDVQCFLGFANFYRRFIHKYSQKCELLYSLTRKDNAFSWTPEHTRIFDTLKEAFCTAPILRHFNPALETLVESDASDFAAAGVLSQRFPEPDGSVVLHPVAYYSRKLTPAECNYGIGDKELLAIVVACEEWRPHLIGTKDPILVLTDHNNLQGFLTKKLLNRRQARWALKLSEYNFKIVYRPGPKNAKADALTRRSGDLPKEGDGRSRPVDAVLKPENFDSASFGPAFGPAFGSAFDSIVDSASSGPAFDSIDAILASVNGDPNLQAPGKAMTGNLAATVNLAATNVLAAAGKLASVTTSHLAAPGRLASVATRNPTHASSFSCFELHSTSRAFHSDIKNALLHDVLGKELIHALRTKANRHPKVALSEYEYHDKDGLLFVNGLLYVPADEELQAKILRHYHDHPAAGHPGRAATYELVSRDYWWPKMRHTIARYLRNCDTCARIKPARHAPYGFLKPLPIPQR
jgi:hypothetical protein